MYAELKDKGVDVIGLGMSAKNVAEIQQNVKEFGTTYPQAVATEDAMRDFGHINDPTTFIIDKKGQIRYRLDGDRDYETYKTIADKLIAEK